MMKSIGQQSVTDSYTFTQQSTRHCTAWNTTIKTKQKKIKNNKAFTSKMLAINRLILLNLYSLLFCTDGSWITIHQPNNPLEEEQHGYTHAGKKINHVNRERKKTAQRYFCHTHGKPTHACTISDHAEDPEYADTRQHMIMNTVHLSLFPPHEKARTHTLTQSLTKKGAQGSMWGVSGIRGGGMWFCSGGLRDDNQGGRERWEPILPTCGRSSACPPVAERIPPWSWPRRPSPGPGATKETQSYKRDQNTLSYGKKSPFRVEQCTDLSTE